MSRRSRVELHVSEEVGAEQRRDLGVFVRHCIERIERDVGRADGWTITIVPDRACYTCEVIVEHGRGATQACGHGFDGAVAGWEAFRDIESRLREIVALEPTQRAEVAGGGR